MRFIFAVFVTNLPWIECGKGFDSAITATLDGYGLGLKFYLVPIMSQLVNVDSWQRGISQIFFSFGLGEGCVTQLASYNRFHGNATWNSTLRTRLRNDDGAGLAFNEVVFQNLYLLHHAHINLGAHDVCSVYFYAKIASLASRRTWQERIEEAAKASDKPHRGIWQSGGDYMMNLVGYTVGIGNIWRYPFVLYESGGGSSRIRLV
ncbi:unnamed protein product [Cyprideis torosa]|uniref:Uncharacterized protein n=1 Tax=Cyprideis torosa TaxID=163714 RepID=A0A7R8ZJY6_9CRUS|nr:unnamed protein product [Cyprideis torosa]CAG0883328.1 unnamed protein product [Cyprideis torosa]